MRRLLCCCGTAGPARPGVVRVLSHSTLDGSGGPDPVICEWLLAWVPLGLVRTAVVWAVGCGVVVATAACAPPPLFSLAMFYITWLHAARLLEPLWDHGEGWGGGWWVGAWQQLLQNLRFMFGSCVCAPRFAVCGPSGVGKSTLIEMLKKDFPDDFGFSVR
jgi:hypothetical protein